MARHTGTLAQSAGANRPGPGEACPESFRENYAGLRFGKTRLRIEVPADADAEQITSILTGHPDVARYVGGATVDRLVVVPGRIANVVTR